MSGPDPPGLGASSGVAAGPAHAEWAPAGPSAGPGSPAPLRVVQQSVHRVPPGDPALGRATDYTEEVLLQQLAGRSFRTTAHHPGIGVGTLRRQRDQRTHLSAPASTATSHLFHGPLRPSSFHRPVSSVRADRRPICCRPTPPHMPRSSHHPSHSRGPSPPLTPPRPQTAIRSPRPKAQRPTLLF